MTRTLALVLTSLALVAPTRAQTTPHVVRLSYADPDTQTRIAITWHSDSAAAQVVEYGVVTTDEHRASATASGTPLGSGIGTVHAARLTDLAPGTTYAYRVGSAADGWAPASGSFSFTTAPASPCEPFTFVALGDVRGMDVLDQIPGLESKWPSVFDHVAAEDPAFVLVAGDLVYNGVNLDDWSALFTQGTDYYAFLPVMPSFGNHDTGGGTGNNYEFLYTLPRTDAGNERYYWFRYGNALFLAVNTEERGAQGDFAEQAAWLEGVLQTEEATWKILFFHHPIWTTTPGETDLGCFICGHPPDEQGQNDALIDLIDRYDIDLVVQSHNHFYERSLPMRGGGSDATKVELAPAYRGTQVGSRGASGRVDTWGSLYVVTGGGGATLTSFAGALQKWAPGSAVHSSQFHHARIDVADLTLSFEVRETRSDGSAGGVLDALTLTKLPEYRVGACTTPAVDPGPTGPTGPSAPGTSASDAAELVDAGCGCRSARPWAWLGLLVLVGLWQLRTRRARR